MEGGQLSRNLGKFHLCSLRAATDGMQETQKLLNTSWNTQNEDKIIKKKNYNKEASLEIKYL